MARKIPFSLKMADGAQVRTMEELRAHFDFEAVLGYYDDGRLCEWLSVRYYDDEAGKVGALDKSSEDFKKKLCEILGVPYSENEAEKVDIGYIAKKNQRYECLKQYTADDAIFEAMDHVAFTQEELEDLLDRDVREIYLCGERFIVPGSRGGIVYKGINHPIVKFDGTNAKTGIDLLDIRFKIDDYLKYGNGKIRFYDFFDENRDLGVRLVHMEAEKDHAPAQVALGDCYKEGYGVEKDYKEAVAWYIRAAEQCYAPAQKALGDCYKDGYGVETNLEKAKKWYQKAVDQDYAPAQMALGDYYCKEDGINRGQKRYGTLWGLSTVHMTKNLEKAKECYQKAAEQDYAPAQVALGDCYYNGYGVERNYEEAVAWYIRAAEQCYAPAQKALGDCYKDGYGVETNLEKAKKWYQKAVDQDYAPAQKALKIAEFVEERGNIQTQTGIGGFGSLQKSIQKSIVNLKHNYSE